MMDMPVYFVVHSDGYLFNASLPGTPKSEPGLLLTTTPGGRATVVLNRTQPAERLYRMTGGGLYRHYNASKRHYSVMTDIIM